MRNDVVRLFVGLFVVLVAFHQADCRKMDMDEIRASIKSIRKACVPKTGVPMEMVEAAADQGVFAEDRRLMCYHECVLSLMKAVKDGELRVSVMTSQADLMLMDHVVDRVKNAVTKCGGEVTATDPCEKAWQFLKCCYETDPEVYFLP